MCLRTPHILEQINELLDNKSLINCKKASRIISSNIENQKRGKFLTTRLIQSYIKNPLDFETDWKTNIQKLPMERYSEFGMMVNDFLSSFPIKISRKVAPMHITAEDGRLDFCILIAKVNASKNINGPLFFFLPKPAI